MVRSIDRYVRQNYLGELAAELFSEIAEKYEYMLDEMEVVKDHIHIFLSFPQRR